MNLQYKQILSVFTFRFGECLSLRNKWEPK
jgi:hypothetical protein